MFGLGWQEILVVIVIAVLVIGPEQLPQVARTLGKFMAQFRRVTNDLRDTINREISEQDELKQFREFTQDLDTDVRRIGQSVEAHVEREIANEEAELKRLEREVVQNDGDPGELKDPATNLSASDWIPANRDVPGEAVAGKDDPPADAAPAASTDGDAATDEPAATPPRKETA